MSSTHLSPPPTVSADRLRKTFHDRFDAEPDGLWASPGRVNLIGEHTDYNGCFVLPIALAQAAIAAVRLRTDDLVRVHTLDLDKTVEVRLSEIAPDTGLDWAAYVAGVGWAAARQGLPVRGIDLAISSNVPVGAGLSSSAALSCATARAWADLLGWDVSDAEVAALGRAAENEIAGAPTGVMDQLASVCGRADHAMMIDTRSIEVTQLPFDLAAAGLSLLVIDSRAPHQLVDGEYGERRTSCYEAARQLGVRQLRDVPIDDIDRILAPLPDRLRRRAHHVITDSHRVEELAEILQGGGDLRRIGPLLNDSHASMRDDFEITVPAVDSLQTAALDAGALGARMTGGGFGGCVIALVEADDAHRIAAECIAAAQFDGHPTPRAFVAETGDGARRLTG